MRRNLVLLFGLAFVLACAPRGSITTYPAAAKVGVVEPIFLATSRGPAPPPTWFGTTREPGVRFARFDISIPPDRKLGSVDFPGRKEPNPEIHMLTVSETLYGNEREFLTSLNSQITRPGSNRRVIVFVHGFNTNMAEGAYRIAQMSHDMELDGTIVHFSWPSLGNALGYVHDRDSALFSRDALEQLLDQVALSKATDVVLMAHSMGSLLAMETLRQMSLRGDSEAYSKLEAVVLISPDIDVDVFRSQMAVIKDPPDPFVIFGSQKDKALKLSSLLVAEPSRLGNMPDTSRIADLPVTYVDVEAFQDGSSHFPLATSPELIELFGRFREASDWLDSDKARTDNPLTGLFMAATTATEIVLTPVTALGTAITRPDGMTYTQTTSPTGTITTVAQVPVTN